MSRGLDVSNLDCVINFECPIKIENYVHRIGRTARGINKGISYTILNNKEKELLDKILINAKNGDKLQEYDMNMNNRWKTIRFHKKYIDKYIDSLTEILDKEQDAELDHNEPILF